MDNCNNHFDFDFSEAVIMREQIKNLEIGEVRSATYGEKPSVSARNDGEVFSLDFVLPLPDGCLNVDDSMSDTSMNPVSNAVVKDYVDRVLPSISLIYANTVGTTDYSSQDLFADYDILVCYASASAIASGSCFSLPIRYIDDAPTSSMKLKVSDNDYYTVFVFGRDGFYADSYSGANSGRIYAVYGISYR